MIPPLRHEADHGQAKTGSRRSVLHHRTGQLGHQAIDRVEGIGINLQAVDLHVERTLYSLDERHVLHTVEQAVFEGSASERGHGTTCTARAFSQSLEDDGFDTGAPGGRHGGSEV